MDQTNNITRFKEVIERYVTNSDIFYRGQAAKYEEISSSIARDNGYLKNEHKVYEESIKMKENEFQDLIYPIQRLAKLQHYGVPTRLIDLTTDPLIALFFAVQNTQDEKDDGYIYLYSQEAQQLDSKEVKLSSVLATLDDYNIENIQQQYKSNFDDKVTREEILALSSEITFVKKSEDLRELNPRLYNQKGTFAICGNIIEGDIIQRKLKTLDDVKPLAIIKIPYEYKVTIKRELDVKYGINETFIYPELPSVATYIREKYKSTNFSSDGKYTLIQKSNISNAGARRISLVIELLEPLSIDEIKEVVLNIIKEQSSNYDVVWVYVAKNGKDYIIKNWILTGQWIRETLDDMFKPYPIGDADNKGYYWLEADDYSVMADFYEENIFKDDKELFVDFYNCFEKVYPLYEKVQNLFKSNLFKEFKDEININADKIREAFLEIGDIGLSSDKDLDEYLHHYNDFLSLFDNMIYFIDEDANSRVFEYQISNCFRDANKELEIIKIESEKWKEKLNIQSILFG